MRHEVICCKAKADMLWHKVHDLKVICVKEHGESEFPGANRLPDPLWNFLIEGHPRTSWCAYHVNPLSIMCPKL
jgi:hypothetical protein